jgi:hypothetical protein
MTDTGTSKTEKREAAYARASTSDHSCDVQLAAIRAHAASTRTG